MTICQVCRHKNRVGEFYCEQCGHSLITTVQAPAIAPDAGTLVCPNCLAHNRAESLSCNQCGGPLPIDGHTPYAGAAALREQVCQILQQQHSGSTATFWHDQPALYIQGAPQPLPLPTEGETILGRKTPKGAGQPTIDLTSFDAYNLGVSRRHAAIRYDNGCFYLQDLHSTNGTYLNSRPVPPDHALILASGDEIRLGNLVCHVYF